MRGEVQERLGGVGSGRGAVPSQREMSVVSKE